MYEKRPANRGSQGLSWSGWFQRPGDAQVALLPGLSCSMEQKAPQVHHFGQHGLAERSPILIKLVNSVSPGADHLLHIFRAINGWQIGCRPIMDGVA